MHKLVKITKKKYTTNLTLNEINTINALKDNYKIFDKTKYNMMSVLSYLTKHGANLKRGFRKSTKDIWTMYKRYHKNIKSFSNFKKIIYKLEDAKLTFIERIGKINIYHTRKFLEEIQEVTQEVTNKNTSESIDITTFESDGADTQIQNINKNYINIINNTPDGISKNDYKNSLAYKKACIENNEDTLSPHELIFIAKNVLKDKRRKSRTILSMVIGALQGKYHVVRANARNYVEAVVADKIAKYEFNREMYALTIAKNKNNYRLAHNKANSTFANFTQRKYDYDKLEKQLLGWASDEEYETEVASSKTRYKK